MRGWIGVDLDGTFAYYDGWKGPEHIGEPIPAMLSRVRAWLHAGIEVRLVTARATREDYVPPIRRWLDNLGLFTVTITCSKDFAMIELWDDRCVRVIPNTGEPCCLTPNPGD